MATIQTSFPDLHVPRPKRPAFIKELPAPRKRLLGPLRRGTKQLLLTAFDSGWLGLRPLRAHVVICGFTRSGSTLLLLMAETCVSEARTFGEEVSALAAAQFAFRNHSVMITKDPGDIFFIDEIRAFYATRRANARFVVTVRDPRAVLTSKHKEHPNRQPGGYYEIPEEWHAYYEQIRYEQQFDDVLTVKYEDLVTDPGGVERRLSRFIGWTVHLPFEQFHSHVSPGFKFTQPLNGVRPPDPTRIDSWRGDEHRERIRYILHALPQLPHCLIAMGYEHDTEWTKDYS
jgi:hypothetical protein